MDQPRVPAGSPQGGEWTRASSGGSSSGTVSAGDYKPPQKKAIEADKDPWSYASYRSAPDTRRSIKSMEEVREYRAELKRSGRLNPDNTVSVWHTSLADAPEQILNEGLIPGKMPSPGQSWQAPLAKFATYAHVDPGPALRDIEFGGTVFEVRIPVTPKSLIRVLPDEESSSNPLDGPDILLKQNGAIAYIGGFPKKWLRIHADNDGETGVKMR